jgi:hypothetical protein
MSSRDPYPLNETSHVNRYTALIHARVREEPSYSVLLRAGFVKLASILDVPLTRINEVRLFRAVGLSYLILPCSSLLT